MAEVLALPHVRPTEIGGRALKAFECVGSDGYRTDSALAAWIQRGIDLVASLQPKRAER